MASRGRGRRGRPRGTGQTPPVFDQQAFVEVVGIAPAAIAQASAAGSQGGPTNLQRFRAHHPPKFTGGGDLMVADHWFIQVEKVLEAMEITSDTTRIIPPAGTSRVQGRVYAITPPAESEDQPVIHGTFLLSRLWARVLFDYGASHSFIVASVVIELGLKVEALEEPLYVSSPLGIKAGIGMICRGCELEISGILLTVDLRVMDMSEFNVILGMD